MPNTPYETTAVATDGVSLACQARGSGPALLLLPGQANNHHWWDRTRADYDDRLTTITFDYRGVGGSDDAADGYSMQQFAADATAVLDHLGFPRAAVYGASMGGRVAQRLAADHPDRVTRLVLGCTAPGGEHSVERDDGVRRALAGPDRRAARLALEDMFYTPEWRATHPGPYAVMGDARASRRAKVGHLKASNAHDAWDDLPRIAAPTLILAGSDDRLAPVANVALLESRIPDARSVVFSGARHGYFDECAPEATTLALEHLCA